MQDMQFYTGWSKKAPYSDTATAVERYPNILRGSPKSRMVLFRNTEEPNDFSRPTRQQVITMLDRYIAEGKAFRFTAMPLPKYAGRIEVTYNDSLEEYQREEGDANRRVTILVWTFSKRMLIERFFLGRYEDLLIFSLD